MSNEADVKRRVQEQFGHNPAKYVTSELHAKGNDLDLMVDWLQPQADWKVLDIATGGGHVAKKLSGYCGHVVATDLTRPMLETAAKHLAEHGCRNVTYVVADAENLPFLDASFDLVTCRIAPHHFPNPQQFMKEVARVLKAGGHFLLIDNVAPEEEALGVFMNTFERLRDESHAKCQTVSQWQKWASELGFEVKVSQMNRKTYVFPGWVARTARNEEQMQKTEAFIAQADPKLQQYFSVGMENGRVQSLQVDEWRAVLCKGTLS